MRIAILTYGSRGDVQPFLALAVRLQRAGHRVTLAAPERFAGLAAEYGVTFAPLAGDPQVLSQVINDAGSNPLRMVSGMQRYVLSIAPAVVRGARQAIQGANVLVHSFLFTTGAHSLACELGIPDVSVQTFPMFAPTRAFPNVAVTARLPGWLNYFSHWLATQIFWYGGNAGYAQLRRAAPQDLPARLHWLLRPSPGRPPTPLIFAYSPVVAPRPPEWRSPQIHIPGYFFLEQPESYQPPAALRQFLAHGAPPVCITFGSMVNQETQRITQAALAALRQQGLRAVFLSGWGGWQPENPPDDCLFLEAAPHDWLFPRCAVIVHHGGAGTTAAALRAGKPNIVAPHAADQPFWGGRVAAIGAGAPPIPVKQFTAERFAAALDAAGAPELVRRAAELGAQIQAEDGTGAAVALIERQAALFRDSQPGLPPF